MGDTISYDHQNAYFGASDKTRNWSLIAQKILRSGRKDYRKFLKTVNKEMYHILFHDQDLGKKLQGVQDLEELIVSK